MIWAWLGTIFFSICAIPQALQCLKTRSAKGLSWWFLLLWVGGEVNMMIYSALTCQVALILNYLFNGICLLIILGVKLSEETK